MSEPNYWNRMRRSRLSRRTLLGVSAKAGVGAAGLALVGCGDDDDDTAAAVTQTQADQDQAEAQAEAQADAQADADTDLSRPTQEDEEAPAVAAASPGDWEGAIQGGEYITTKIMTREPPSLDPFIETSFLAQYVGTHAYSRMLKASTGPGVVALANIEGDAAESFEIINDDATEFIFNIRDMVYHDIAPISGRKLDAEDVTASMDRFLALSANAPVFDMVDSFEAVDTSTVKATLNKTTAAFIENMSSPSSLFIQSKEALAGDIDPTKEEGIIGTGPWQWGTLTPATELIYTRNPNWYKKVTGVNGEEISLPLVDQIRYVFQPEYGTALSLFVAGDTDDFDPLNRDIGTLAEQRPDSHQVPDENGWLWSGWQFNQTSENGLWQDPRARIAISKAIDRPGLLEAFGELETLRGQGFDIPSGWNTPTVPWGEGNGGMYLNPEDELGQEWADNLVQDVAEGTALLEAAGYDGSPVDMNYLQSTYGTVYDQWTEAVIPMLQAIGLNINSQIREYAQQWSSEASRDFPGLYYNYVTPFNTIGEYMNLWFGRTDDVRHSAQRKITTPSILEKVQAQEVALDRADRTDIIHDIIREGAEIMHVAPTVINRFGTVRFANQRLRNFYNFETNGYGFPTEDFVHLWKNA